MMQINEDRAFDPPSRLGEGRQVRWQLRRDVRGHVVRGSRSGDRVEQLALATIEVERVGELPQRGRPGRAASSFNAMDRFRVDAGLAGQDFLGHTEPLPVHPYPIAEVRSARHRTSTGALPGMPRGRNRGSSRRVPG